MIDREKVRKGIAFCLSGFHCGEDCPYYNVGKTVCMWSLQKDALELLKEQEPVTWSYEYNCFICSNCGLAIEDEVNYLMNNSINFCPTCGRKVKWNDYN